MYIEFRAEDTQVDELKVPATCAWAVSQVGNTMDKAGLWFSESEAAQMVQCGLLYVQCHVWLAREALLAARPRYKVRPRLHSFLCEVIMKIRAGSRLNPKFTACWSDESYIGRVCAISKSNAVHPVTLGLRMLQRLEMQLNAHLAGE